MNETDNTDELTFEKVILHTLHNIRKRSDWKECFKDVSELFDDAHQIELSRLWQIVNLEYEDVTKGKIGFFVVADEEQSEEEVTSDFSIKYV